MWIRQAVVRVVIVAASTLTMMAALASPSEAVLADTRYTKLDGGRADFGAGTHSLGSPQDSAVVTYDFEYDPFGRMVITARLRGTLYWDSLLSAGCARLTITFVGSRSPQGTRQIERCGPGGNANATANQKAVDETFSALSDWAVVSVNEVVNGKILPGAEATLIRVSSRTFPVKINNGSADFGSGLHAAGAPTGDGSVRLVMPFGDKEIDSQVTGRLFWDSLFASGCARLVIEHRTTDNTVLEDKTRDTCGPGGNANSSDNYRSIDVSSTLGVGPLWNVRLRVGTLAGSSFVGVVNRTFDFNGPVGTSELTPADAIVAVDELFQYQLAWTVPQPENWHNLRSLQLRIRDEEGIVLWVLWDEARNSFSLFNEPADQFGPDFPAGHPARLQTRDATLHLAATSVAAINSVLGRGPTSPGVMLSLALSFKRSTAGRTFHVDVAGSDDLGNDDPFVEAGTVTVVPKGALE